ncbi:MAG TPA: phosphoribosylanthranilate isomerase [Candidatus Angelobacter sp.]|nr:phosphoribosylanthranilate isomerase [Candidatus Angelobacter sp.]
MRTWIKFCGTTSLADALASVEAGADALGFIFAPSKRQITPEKAREIIRELPESIERVGVFVDESADTICEIVKTAALTMVQLHGNESPEFIARFQSGPVGAHKLRVIKTVVVRGDFHLELEKFVNAASPPDAILLDSGAGSGRVFDWRGVRPFLTGTEMRFIVAGGLDPSNVSEALAMFRPFGVDVVSGVETAPGKKDPVKLQAFVAAVRNAEKESWAARQ